MKLREVTIMMKSTTRERTCPIKTSSKRGMREAGFVIRRCSVDGKSSAEKEVT